MQAPAFLELPGRRFLYSHIKTALEFVPQQGAEPFACLLWNAAMEVEPQERADLARRLIAAGCTYLVAGGFNSEEWHDAADEEFIALGLTGDEYDRRFLMTTWHTGETVEEVAFGFACCTFPYRDSGLDNYSCFLVLQFGGDDDLGIELREAIRGQVVALGEA